MDGLERDLYTGSRQSSETPFTSAALRITQHAPSFHLYQAGNPNPHASFTETGRDEWSVYLRKSDGLGVQLDLWRKEVIVNGGKLYSIQQAL